MSAGAVGGSSSQPEVRTVSSQIPMVEVVRAEESLKARDDVTQGNASAAEAPSSSSGRPSEAGKGEIIDTMG